MKIHQLIGKLSIAAAMLACASAQATVLDLPAANAMSVGQYNSFNVYSLDLLDQCAAAGDARCLPANGLPVKSAPGDISDQAIVLQSANGHSNFPSPFAPGAKADNRFLTPTGNQSVTYAMGSFGAEPGSKWAGGGDLANRWDISLGLLQTYLDGNDLVFLFDNNQENNRNGNIIFLWGQARIVDASGNTVNNLCFELSFNAGGCTDAGANPAPTVPEYLPAVTDFCVDKADGSSYNIGTAFNAGDCPANGAHPQGGYHVNNNVSTSVAEFAAFNQALHNAATDANNSQYFLSLNIKYISNNAGAEQLWICSDCNIGGRTTDVPEPASLALLGMGLAGLVLARRRRK